MIPTNIKKLQKQAKDLHAYVVDAHTVVVESRSTPTANHVVTVQYGSDHTIHARCTCPWASNGSIGCSHVMAALDALAELKGRKLSFWGSAADAERQKQKAFVLKGYGQDLWITSRNAPNEPVPELENTPDAA